VRFGGISSISIRGSLIATYVVGYPDAPTRTAITGEMDGYFNSRLTEFLIRDGVVTIFATLFVLWFLTMLHSMLRRLRAREAASHLPPGGRLVYVTLVVAGLAVELLYPAIMARFENFQQDAQIGFMSP
jgi:hypothetical protein